jgi:hypothetical protein
VARLARRTFWVFAIGGIVAGFVVFILGVVLSLGNNDKYGKVPVPGEGRVQLDEGKVLVYYEERAGLSSNSSLNAPPLELRVRSLDTGKRLEPERIGSRSTYQYNNLDGTSVARLHVPADGSYAVVVRSAERRPYPDPAITFGPDLDFGTVVLHALTVAAIGLGLALLLAIVGYAGRRPPTPVQPASAPAAPREPIPPLVPVPGTEPPAPGSDPAQQLRTLEDMKGRGDLTEAEYEKRRAGIIDQI